ncbi:MAG: hypothetical protein IKV43_02825, partial [Clostridia bacterium]|nr:hypothetical protein [Clostridia bacterium]
MKKAISIMLLLALVISVGSVLTACKKDDAEPENPIEYCECAEPNEAKRTENSVPATCVDSGSYELVTYCEDCGKYIESKVVSVPPTGEHTAGEPFRLNEEQDGCYTSYDEITLCKVCDLEMGRRHISNPDNHIPDEEPKIVDGAAAGCGTDGYYYVEVWCTACDELLEREMKTIPAVGHSFDDDGVCTSCGVMEHYMDIYWAEEDEFIFCLTENTNNQELSSGCARYLAGRVWDYEARSVVDDLVTDRNELAREMTNMRPTYQYVPEDREHGIGQNAFDMVADMSCYISGIVPDVYCNFTYDMVAASLYGAFANLKTTSVVTDGEVRKNYFRFADPTYNGDEGYMLEYMDSLTLSGTKQYCLASDYFTDVMRAACVVPVSVTLLETIPLSDVEGAFNYDYIADGKYTIEDFYQFVYTGGWSYATIAEISQVYDIFESDGAGDSNGDLEDRLVFAISTRAASMCGIFHSSVGPILEKNVDADGNSTLSFPEADDVAFSAMATAYSDASRDLFSRKGVIAVTDNNVGSHYNNNPVMAIRDRFARNKILFGGVVMLGWLENYDYSSMEGGFGVVPVPLSRTVDENGNPVSYATLAYNRAKVGAINAKTTKFAKISAYLDCVSVTSTDVLEAYFEHHVYNAENPKANKDMLVYIRSTLVGFIERTFLDVATGNANDNPYLISSTAEIIKGYIREY